jgi:hypothetical protein
VSSSIAAFHLGLRRPVALEHGQAKVEEEPRQVGIERCSAADEEAEALAKRPADAAPPA